MAGPGCPTGRGLDCCCRYWTSTATACAWEGSRQALPARGDPRVSSGRECWWPRLGCSCQGSGLVCESGFWRKPLSCFGRRSQEWLVRQSDMLIASLWLQSCGVFTEGGPGACTGRVVGDPASRVLQRARWQLLVLRRFYISCPRAGLPNRGAPGPPLGDCTCD